MTEFRTLLTRAGIVTAVDKPIAAVDPEPIAGWSAMPTTSKPA